MKIDIGPVTRLEGHLNINTTVENNIITDAKSMGEMFRGFEVFLLGRDPLDAQQITQRICGVCPYAHAIASSYAQEAAYRLRTPPNGRILHNLIQGANHLYDYLLHFYQLSALDFIDVTAITGYTGKDRDLTHLKEWVNHALGSGESHPAAPFLPRLSGTYVTDADINITALKHYVESLEIQKKANRASAIFGGRFPHATGIFPGGCTRPPDIDAISSYQALIHEVKHFIHNKYLPDLLAVAGAFPEYWHIGQSKGGFMSYGLLPFGPEPDSPRLLSPGVLIDGKVETVKTGAITEDVKFAKYSSPSGLKVTQGRLTPAPHKEGAYSWVKAPRYGGHVLEVGPAARILVDYLQGGNETVKQLVDRFAGMADIGPEQLNSVLGRHLCRAVSAVVIADFLLDQTEQINPSAPFIPEIKIPEAGEGFGLTEASRGALLHYIRIRNYKIDHYECVVPTTWNCSPRDDTGRPGALESALIGTRVEDPAQQIEANRIVHSFDPCLACAVH
ncbi:nickel-dependent hydrogenase large subunit [Desulfobacter sp.]|jgi:ferredoxin hydrogenase large subunit/hydrogenase large subunit|uniref:nickel-dependent hydrogenase large subunit n=1 Tax=Desulfobacter sp. TaxID=2294 RepID=UPI000E89CD7F|nr:nickel-dependent hydrogenase large subunit [Desulfobacter sp.]HBT86983.1 nickel-dependent hydrogenase large subunit [Desulfobacter sp.]